VKSQEAKCALPELEEWVYSDDVRRWIHIFERQHNGTYATPRYYPAVLPATADANEISV
jgi:hypothetical protein